MLVLLLMVETEVEPALMSSDPRSVYDRPSHTAAAAAVAAAGAGFSEYNHSAQAQAQAQQGEEAHARDQSLSLSTMMTTRVLVGAGYVPHSSSGRNLPHKPPRSMKHSWTVSRYLRTAGTARPWPLPMLLVAGADSEGWLHGGAGAGAEHAEIPHQQLRRLLTLPLVLVLALAWV